MKIIGVIPARGGSSRFFEKPLALIAGKPMLFWVYKHCKEVSVLMMCLWQLIVKKFDWLH